MVNFAFNGLQKLRPPDDILTTNLHAYQLESIVMLPYIINEDLNTPFLMYGLKKHTQQSATTLTFINGDPTLLEHMNDPGTILAECNKDIQYIFSRELKEYQMHCRGWICKGGILFIVYEVNVKHISMLSGSTGSIVFALVTELLNDKRVSNMEMTPEISEFFSNTMWLCTLHVMVDGCEQIAEVPCVFYTCVPRKMSEFISLFGINKKIVPEHSKRAYYYVYNYTDAKNEWHNLTRINGIEHTVIRHVIFLKRHVIIMNNDDHSCWNEDFYDSAIILNNKIVNTNNNRQMVLAVKNISQLITISMTNGV